MKVVNSAATRTETEIDLAGSGKLANSAQAFVRTSASPKDENTLDEPTKVAPKTENVMISGAKFTREFPGNSFTVLRIPTVK